jgi:hypothetical protein
MNMKAPTCKLGKFIIKYKQVLYDDRYFFVSHEDCRMCGALSRKHIIQIPGGLVKDTTISLFDWLVQSCAKEYRRNYLDRIERFMGRIERYDECLDSDMR